MEELGDRMSEEQIIEMLNNNDLDHDGLISFEVQGAHCASLAKCNAFLLTNRNSQS